MAGLPLSPSGSAVRTKPSQSRFMTWERVCDRCRTHKRDYTCICVCCFHYICPSKRVSPPSPPFVPCLIIISSCLCLPRSLMMTGMAGLPESQVPTLMSPCLTPLLSAQVSPHPCPLIYNVPGGCWGGGGQSLKQRKGGFIVLFSLSTVSLYLWHLQHDRGRGVTPGRTCGPQNAGDGDLAECCGSLADYKTIAPLPITLRESAGWKFGWMRAITRSHARLDHEGWVMVRFGSAGGSGRFNALSATMDLANVIWHRPLGRCHMFCIVVQCSWWKIATLMLLESKPGREGITLTVYFHHLLGQRLWDVFFWF